MPLTELDDLGTVLKNALWDPERYSVQVDDTIRSYLRERMSQNTNHVRILDGTSSSFHVFSTMTFRRAQDHRATAEEETKKRRLPSCQEREDSATHK
jgi:hypothetical protein